MFPYKGKIFENIQTGSNLFQRPFLSTEFKTRLHFLVGPPLLEVKETIFDPCGAVIW